METRSDGHESEQVADAFVCCVCLDLLYKPVVLACGHASCFWCVHKSMSGLRESHCPLCRHPYYHFPTICQMLHVLLSKLYPLTFERREQQILEEEKKKGFFSPSFNVFGSSDATEDSYIINVQEQSFTPKTMDPGENTDQAASVQYNGPTIAKQSYRASAIVPVDEDDLPQARSCDSLHHILIDDVLCATCKQLLFRPVVLNCGHVYCESCLIPSDGSIKCQICPSLHPRGFPKVYLELDHFLEEIFPKEYVARKITVQPKGVQFQHENPPKCSEKDGDGVPFPSLSDKRFLSWCADNGSNVHVGAGCDHCGMYPIIGDRYRCRDCKEAVGFDLCGDCYNTQSKRPGRFNQQHTPDHSFENVKSSTLYSIILRLLRVQSENGHRPTGPGPDALENVFTPADMAQESSENVMVGPSAPSVIGDHSDDDEAQHAM